MRRVILMLLADTHGWHRLGLLNPDTVLHEDDGSGDLVEYRPGLTNIQRILWRYFEKDIAAVKELAGDDEIIPIHDGDATQGSKYKSHLVSNRESDQVEVGVSNLRPIASLDNVRTMRINLGTAAHNFDEGASETLIARQLQAEFPGKDIKALYHNLIDVDGYEIDVSHHGPHPGSRNWLEGNVARLYLRDLMMGEIMDGHKPPDLVVRAHRHALVTEFLEIRARGRKYTSRLIVLPSYCGMGDHTRQATRSRHKLTVGMAGVELVDGRFVEMHEFTHTRDIRVKEKL